MSVIEPKFLEGLLIEISHLFRKQLTDDVVAIDGKSLCGSRDQANDTRAIHILHAWSCANRICLAQAKSMIRAMKLQPFAD